MPQARVILAEAGSGRQQNALQCSLSCAGVGHWSGRRQAGSPEHAAAVSSYGVLFECCARAAAAAAEAATACHTTTAAASIAAAAAVAGCTDVHVLLWLVRMWRRCCWTVFEVCGSSAPCACC